MSTNSAAPNAHEPHDQDSPLTPDPARQWYLAHYDELRQYKGKTVAISPTRGLVAVGTLAEVQEQLYAMGEPYEDSDVVISVVH